MSRILIIDDEQSIQVAFELLIQDMGHESISALTAADGLTKAREFMPEIIFLDYRLPDMNGLEILPDLKKIVPEAAVICMTAFGTMDVAVGAMREGAYEYLVKPLDLEEVAELIVRLTAVSEKASGSDLAIVSSDVSARGTLVGNSPAMQEIYKLIGLLTGNTVTVLITGESGVGKELVARAIHFSGYRAKGPWVPVNCGAMPDQLIESELFGYEPGAFTGAVSRKPGKFELADGGTLFLDEVSELPLSAQVKLLRVLQDQCLERLGGNKSVRTDVRIVAATNRDLREMVRMGVFRPDLYYRLNIMTIHVPPLRERKEDIPALAMHFIGIIAAETGCIVNGITERAMNMLVKYDWPGNVRQLENGLRRAAVISRDPYLDVHHLDILTEEPSAPYGEDLEKGPDMKLQQLISQMLQDAYKHGKSEKPLFNHILSIVEKTLVDEALNIFNNNQVQAASFLKISRSTLRKKMSQISN